MSGTLDALISQNLTRAQAVNGIIQAANQTFSGANVTGAGRAAITGSLISQVGGIISGFSTGQVRAPEKGFNVSNFLSKINSYGGLSGTSRFMVNITPPPCMDSAQSIMREDTNGTSSAIRPLPEESQRVFGGKNGYDLIFLCPRTSLPGLNINTSQIFHLGHGTTERRPARAVFDTITFNFYVDISGISMGFFTKWLSNIVNFNDESVGERTASGAFFNEVFYKNNYASTISIYVFDHAGNGFLECKLIDAFPVGIGEIDLNWANTDDIAILPVTFSYKTWKSNFTPPAEIGAGSLRNISLASALLRVGSAVQAGSNLFRRPTNVVDAFNLVRNGSRLLSSFL